MWLGIGAMVLVGISWTIFGFAMGKAPKQNIDVAILLFLSTALAFVVSLMLGILQGFPETSAFGLIIAFGPLVLCGALNYFQLDLMSRAMQQGPNGIIWSIVQAGFIFPFFMGILFFHVSLTGIRAAGFIFILASLGLFGIGRNNEAAGKWKLLAFASFITTGFSQSLSNLPSYFPEADAVSSVWRTAAFSTGLMTTAFCVKLTEHKVFSRQLKDSFFRKEILFFCLLLEGFELGASLFLLYPGMNLLSKAGIGSVAYPIMVSSCIIGFELFTIIWLKERRNWIQLTALTLCLAGVVCICL